MSGRVDRNTRQAFFPAPLVIFPVLGVMIGVTTLVSVLLGVIPFFYETIHAQPVRWLAVLLRGV